VPISNTTCHGQMFRRRMPVEGSRAARRTRSPNPVGLQTARHSLNCRSKLQERKELQTGRSPAGAHAPTFQLDAGSRILVSQAWLKIGEKQLPGARGPTS